MKITKLPHAAMSIENGGTTLLVDPGALVAVDPELFTTADAILYTHNHFDHFAPHLIPEGFAGHILVPADAFEAVSQFAGARAVKAGDSITIGAFTIEVSGDKHLGVDNELPDVDNVGYLLDGEVFITGDAFIPSAAPVILTGFNGPWQSMPMLLDYLRSTPGTVYGVHDALLSAEGRSIVEYFVGAEAKRTGRELRLLEAGEIVTV